MAHAAPPQRVPELLAHSFTAKEHTMKTTITTLALLMAKGAGAARAQTTDQVQAVIQVLKRNAVRQAGLAVDLAH